MTIVWRGAGILVPILFVGSGLLMSIWYDNPTLGNGPYLAWTSMISGILCLLLGLATLPGKTTDEETGQVVSKKKHDFFFLPIIVWAILLLGLGIYNMIG